MVENGTLIEKIEKHPKIWGAAAAVIALICILSGVFVFLVRPCTDTEDINKAPYFGHAEGEVSSHDSTEDFEVKNSLCRYIPTGNEYFYRIFTDDGSWVYVRAGKDEKFEKGKNISGRVRKFSGDEMKHISDTYALEDERYIDMTWAGLGVLQIVSGLIVVMDIVLGALMIKDKIAADSRLRRVTEIVFCAMPFPIVVIWIYLMGHI
jgi:hypothetical protein